MKSRIFILASATVVGVVGPTVAAAPPSIAVRPLPGDREGVVLAYRARAHVAVVAMRSGQLLTVHSLRRVPAGTGVQVGGIKWGTPTPGIKWGTAPQGIKWGIKWSRSGTYASSLFKSSNGLRTVPVRGTVVGRNRNGIAIGTRGGVIAVRVAVWLPGGGKRTTALRPSIGDVVVTTVRVGPKGRLIGSAPRIVNAANTRLAAAGRLSRISKATRTIRISNVADPALGFSMDLKVPTSVDMDRLRLNSEVAADGSFAPAGGVRADQIAPTTSFAAANDPSNILVAPPPADAGTLDLIRRTTTLWQRGRTDGVITDVAFFEEQAGRLARADAAASDGNRAAAKAELLAFIDAVVAAIPAKVTAQLAADVLAPAKAAAERL